jgi:hypothetical protein
MKIDVGKIEITIKTSPECSERDKAQFLIEQACAKRWPRLIEPLNPKKEKEE